MSVERSRLQSGANLERMLVITAFVRPCACCNCEAVLNTEQWQVLWLAGQSG